MRPSLAGLQIDEYRLETMLGEGGMASVYRAVDVRLNRYVAIKVIQTSFRDNSTYVMRFEREAQAIAQLEHPNIITLYRFGDKDGLLYLAMQYVDGADLATVIDSFRQDDTYIDYADVIRLAHEVGTALDYSHSKGVIHRDIKPHNIMINQENRAIVTDFGLALLTELGTQGEIFGSPNYIAPEQAISSAGAVPQSDLYAFGIVLYEMLTNMVPFTAENPLDVAMLHMSEPVPSPRDFRPELSEAVEKVLFKALAKAPEDRYSAGKALAEALEKALLAKDSSARKSASIAQRVAHEIDANPLPPIPVAMVATPTQRNEAPPTRTNEWKVPSTLPSKPRSRLPIYAGIGIGAALVLILVLALMRGTNNTVTDPTESAVVIVESPTSTNTDFPTTTIQPTNTLESPTVTFTPQPAFTQTPLPTLEPTSTPFDNGGSVTQVRLLTDGRGLTTGAPITYGEVEVEGYCTRLNSNYTAAEDGVNWYCLENGQRVVTLTGTDFNEICRLTYNQTSAFAIQVQGDIAAAYRWRCFGESNPASYTIVIRWRNDDSLFVTNEGTTAFPLNGLALIGEGQVSGAEWGIDYLLSGQCVAVWKDSGRPRAADNECTQVGNYLTREGRERFWKSDFSVYYNQIEIDECDDSPCTVQIQP